MSASEGEEPAASAEFDQLVAELAEFLILVPDEAWVDREEDAYMHRGRAGSPIAALKAIRDVHYGGAK